MTSKFQPVPKPDSGKNTNRQKINNRNRQRGKATEAKVAELTGGTRVPMSGAIKGSIHRLEGDVRVPKANSIETLALIEVKNSSGINPKGDKVFNLKKSVLDQAKAEAKIHDAVAAVYLHWHAGKYEDDYVIIPSDSFIKLLDLAKQAGLIIETDEDSDQT